MKRLAFLTLLLLAPISSAIPASAASTFCVVDYPKQGTFASLGPALIEYHVIKNGMAGTITVTLIKAVPANHLIRVDFVCA